MGLLSVAFFPFLPGQTADNRKDFYPTTSLCKADELHYFAKQRYKVNKLQIIHTQNTLRSNRLLATATVGTTLQDKNVKNRNCSSV